jgi:hypothetical protein
MSRVLSSLCPWPAPPITALNGGLSMTQSDALLDPDDEALPEDECTGNPATCPCEACQSWRIDMEADQ